MKTSEPSFIKILFMVSVFAGVMALLGTGCSSIKASKVGDQVFVNMPVFEHMPVFVKPTVETKDTVINGSATVHSIFGIFTWGCNAQAVGVNYGGEVVGDLHSFTSMSEIIARNAAAYKATTSANADIILAPQYVVTIEDYFIYKIINCKVKGYPGYIKGVKVVDCLKTNICK